MNKRGGAIVESVMVFPLVVLSVAALISMMSYFYLQLSQRVDMHTALRMESGLVCGNLFYENHEETSFPVYKKVQQLYSEGNVALQSGFLLHKRDKNMSARKYLIDEAKVVRMASAVGDGVADIE